jgi:uncharacterized protein (DUF2147 family)
MKKLFSLFFIFFLSYAHAASTSSPIGQWQTIDDITGKPKAIVKITATSQGLTGQILNIFPSPGHTVNELCTACSGAKHNQPIKGMIILENLVQNKSYPTQWIDGKILDPKNGKTYHCMVQLTDNGNALTVRGFIGMPLFGRSQTWIRVDKA